MKKDIVCGVVITCQIDNITKCLMFRRSIEVKNPLVWSFPMGHAEPSEQALYHALDSKRERYEVLIDIMLRELEEETALLRSHIGTILERYIKIATKKKSSYFFISRVNQLEYEDINNSIVLNFENDDFKWFDLETFNCDNCLHPSITLNFDLFMELINGV